MKILVCIKQVPDMESRFKVNGEGIWYDETDLAFRMNEYDEYAVEQAVQVKEQLGNTPDITVLSIGPDRVVEMIKKALAMGCDRGSTFRTMPPSERSVADRSPIAGFSRNKNFDLIFTGMQSQDRGSAQVGAFAAELLGIPAPPPWSGLPLPTGPSQQSGNLRGA